MSTGGKFLLNMDGGLQGVLLNSHDSLIKRLNTLIQSRDDENMTNTLLLPDYSAMEPRVIPYLNEIEQSHTMFTNYAYKPCVSTTYEYIKIGAQGSLDFGQTLIFQPTQVGSFINDMVLHIKISGLRAKDQRDRVRYVAFPGHKLIEKVSFFINNGNAIDEYNTEDYNNFYLYEVNSEEKKKKWCRNVGQELPKVGFLTADPSFDMHREYRMIGDGFQTLKYSHDTLEMFIPLIFWFNELKTALPSHIIPWGQMQINIKLNNISDIVGFADYGGGGEYYEPRIDVCNLYINNIFIPDDIFQIYAKHLNFMLIRTHQHHRQQIKMTGASNRVLLNNVKFPIENLFFSFKPRENLNLSQHWFRTLKLTEKTFKVPVVAKNISTVITGSVSTSTSQAAVLVPGSLSSIDNTYNGYYFILTGGTGWNSVDIMLNRYIVSDYNGTTKEVTLSTSWTGITPDATTTFELFTPQLAINTISYYEETPVVKTISLSVNDIDIWRDQPEKFYNSYLPYRFDGGGLMGLPDERGTYFIPFNLLPLHYKPSGSFNSSIGRELYLNFTSDLISNDFPVDLIVSARVINFLLVKNGSMSLKYIT